MHKEERDVFENMRTIGKCYTTMEKFSTLDSSEKTIAILGGRWRPQKTRQEGGKVSKNILINA